MYIIVCVTAETHHPSIEHNTTNAGKQALPLDMLNPRGFSLATPQPRGQPRGRRRGRGHGHRLVT